MAFPERATIAAAGDWDDSRSPWAYAKILVYFATARLHSPWAKKAVAAAFNSNAVEREEDTE